MDFEVLPLFSFPVAIMDIDEDFSNLENAIDHIEWHKTDRDKVYVTPPNFLEKFPKESDIFLKYFCDYKNNVLHLDPVDFLISSSWMNKIEPGGDGHRHCHTNSIYSCIFYFDSYDGGDVCFHNPFPVSYELDSDDTEHNIFNSHEWSINPQKNRMIIFPSQLYHEVEKNISEKNRYSLAFNLFPYGQFGGKDSALNIQHV
jgi:hypothetical protein